MSNRLALLLTIFLPGALLADINTFSGSSLFHHEWFTKRWTSEFFSPSSSEWVAVTLDVSDQDGRLFIDLDFADQAGICDAQLTESGIDVEGYLVIFDAVASRCNGAAVDMVILIPDESGTPWPRFHVYGRDGELANGHLGEYPEHWSGLDKKLRSKVWHRRKELEERPVQTLIARSDEQSLFSACRAREKLAQVTNDQRWCECIDGGFEDALSDTEYSDAVADYNAFVRKMFRDPNETGDWRYTNVINACRACKDKGYQDCLPHDTGRPSKNRYLALLEALGDTRAATIDRSKPVYSNFFVDYIQAYFENCESVMGEYELRRTVWFEVDELGRLPGDPEEYELGIELAYLTAYDRHVAVVASGSVGRLNELIRSGSMEKVATGLRQLTGEALREFYETRVVLNDHLSSGCRSPQVQTVYQRMLELEG